MNKLFRIFITILSITSLMHAESNTNNIAIAGTWCSRSVTRDNSKARTRYEEITFTDTNFVATTIFSSGGIVISSNRVECDILSFNNESNCLVSKFIHYYFMKDDILVDYVETKMEGKIFAYMKWTVHNRHAITLKYANPRRTIRRATSYPRLVGEHLVIRKESRRGHWPW